jgi:hypothetical protein
VAGVHVAAGSFSNRCVSPGGAALLLP